METEAYDWSRLTVRININASLDKLYNAWATREGIEHWFLRLSEYKSLMELYVIIKSPFKKVILTNGYGMAGAMIQQSMEKYLKQMKLVVFHSALVKQVFAG